MPARIVELLTIAEAADRSGLHYNTIWAYAKDGKFPVYKGGRAKTWHISATDLANFLELQPATSSDRIQATETANSHVRQPGSFRR